MRCEKIVFSEYVYMRALLWEKKESLPNVEKRPAIVICPGSGYYLCSEREADPISQVFSAAGYQTFILYYSLNKKAAFPQPVLDISKAVAHIRANTEEYGVIPDKIAVYGFSAGGHVCGCLGTLWNREEIKSGAGIENEESRPNAMILGYPVLSTAWINKSEREDGIHISGTLDETQREQLLNCANNIGDHTPPAFIFHTQADSLVPVTDSLTFTQAMVAHNIPVELHIFPEGDHGGALGTMLTNWKLEGYNKWTELCLNWLCRTFNFPE